MSHAAPAHLALNDSACESAHALAPTLVAARQGFVRGCASVEDMEYGSWLAQIGAWERRFLVQQA